MMNRQPYNDYSQVPSKNDSLAGEFGMWQPHSANQMSNVSTTTDTSWQVNRDNAINEARRSIGDRTANFSGNMPTAQPSQFSMNPSNQFVRAQQDFSQMNSYNNLPTQQLPPAQPQPQYYNPTNYFSNQSASSYAGSSPYSQNSQKVSRPTASLNQLDNSWSNSASPSISQENTWRSFDDRRNENPQVIYKNPLDDENTSNQSAEDLVAKLKETADKERVQLQTNNYHQPAVLSNAALAVLSKDLTDAAAPFESAETLKKFRNLQLGISNDPLSFDKSKIVPMTNISSNLSVNAVEFIPKYKTSQVKEYENIADRKRITRDKFGEDCLAEADKKNIKAELAVQKQKALYLQNDSELVFRDKVTKLKRNSISNADASSGNVTEPDLCWNPLYGPKLSQETGLKCSKNLSKGLNKKCSGNSAAELKTKENRVNGKVSFPENADNKFKPNSVLPNDELAAANQLCYSEELSHDYYLPLLGIVSLSDLGFWSDVEVDNALRAKVTKTEDLPTSVKQDGIDSENEVAAINLTDEYIDLLVCNPACFDGTVQDFVGQLRAYDLSDSAVSVITDKIYEMCVMERNFRYLGSRLCDYLGRSLSGLDKFRTTLLKKAQDEFNSMDSYFSGSPRNAQRARNFTQFTAELFLNLLMEKNRQRIAVLGRGTFGVVRKLIDHPDDENLQCAIRVLKLTMTAMEDSLTNDERGSIEKLDKILNDLEDIHRKGKTFNPSLNELTLNLLNGLVQLRQHNWGRESVTSSSDTLESRLQPPEVLLQQDENYYMNEPVFFTPDGKQYTAADAANPEFYSKHLAPYSVRFTPADQSSEVRHNQKTANSNLSFNPLTGEGPSASEAPYPAWSPGEADQFDPGCGEDDYDADLETFLLQTGQLH